MSFSPPPNTAIVFPVSVDAPKCAAASIPSANPLIMQISRFASSEANILAYFLPYSLQSLEPTIATIFS